MSETADGESFACGRCKGTFEKTRSDEEALAEAESLWTPETMAQEQAVICDPCFREFIEWAQENVPETLLLATGRANRLTVVTTPARVVTTHLEGDAK